MSNLLTSEQRRAFLRRGFSRRDFGRLAAFLTAGAALPFYNEAALAQGLSAMRNLPPDAIRINANENPLGPCAEALEAMRAVLPQGGRYLYNETFALADLVADIEGLKRENVMPFAGSSDPLHRVVLAYSSPEKSFVVAEPGYEAGGRAAKYIGAKVVSVPLRKDGSHDPQAMASADANTGVIYVCNPNNPTGSVTRKEDVDYIVANKPKGSIVLLDEAYIHFSHTAVPGTPYITANQDVIILRTFSKLYGMAGLRAGYALGRPELLEPLRKYAAGALPVTGMVGAIASLKAKSVVTERKKLVAETRQDLFDWMDKKGLHYIPSEANMFMVDTGRPGKQVFEAMLKHKVVIGRTWPSRPTSVRVSIGTPAEMSKFKAAFEAVLSS
ncbi:MAG: pyridoxal phosphate-dependent aminotransferase [Planctomycetota bacterium]|nr:pyridoxal phosphate-dependent aminotransferase [Planctomycetota bacterium]